MKIIRVIAGNNAERKTYSTPNTRTIREFLETETTLDCNRGTLHLSGTTLMPEDLDRTFEEMGIEDTCSLLSIIKADNA